MIQKNDVKVYLKIAVSFMAKANIYNYFRSMKLNGVLETQILEFYECLMKRQRIGRTDGN